MGPGEFEALIPIVAIVIGGLIAVAAIMSGHQRKMAELVRKDQQEPGLVDEVRAMRAELAQLSDRVNQQTLAIDSSSAVQQQRREPPDVPERLTD